MHIQDYWEKDQGEQAQGEEDQGGKDHEAHHILSHNHSTQGGQVDHDWWAQYKEENTTEVVKANEPKTTKVNESKTKGTMDQKTRSLQLKIHNTITCKNASKIYFVTPVNG